ncbi:hypothetical protein E0387_22005 [Escherichia coli]|nr:hypothetical protein [Escherichia coli]
MPGMLFHTALWRAGCQDRCRCQQGDKIQCATGTSHECLLTFISLYSVSYITADYLIISFRPCLATEQTEPASPCFSAVVPVSSCSGSRSACTVCPAQLSGFTFPVSIPSGSVAGKPRSPAAVKR